MDITEILAELLMEGLLLYVFYGFWQSYRRTNDRAALLLTWTFGAIFVAHTVFALIVEDLLHYPFPKVLEPHHVLFIGLLVAIVYIQRQKMWRAKLHVERESGKKAA